MNLNEIIKITKGKLISGEITNKTLGKLCVDSRKIEQNDIFVAIKGENVDGNNYIEDIIDISSLIITTKNIKYSSKTPIIKVKNSYKAITKIGKYNRTKHINKPLIAITGSVGKTTTKELISQILNTEYNVLKTEGNKNNELGVPLMLSQINDNHEIIVLELGMNHRNEIKRLTKICKPDIAIITNIGTAHIGNLKSQKNILKAKLEIITKMKNKTLIINGNDKFLKTIKKIKNLKIIKTKKINDVIINNKLNFKVNINKKSFQISYPTPNKCLIDNINIAIETAKLYNIKPVNIINTINNFKQVKNRSNIINLNNNITLIDDTYNASLESIKGSLELLKNTKNKKLLILGDVLELGKKTKKIHKQIETEIDKVKNIKTITVGENTKIIKQGKHFNNNQEIINYLEQKELKNITILIKGSRRMHLEEIKDYLTNKYSL